MEQYTYKGLYRLGIFFRQLCGILGILLFTILAGGLLYGMWHVEVKDTEINLANDPRVTLICLSIWILIISWSVGLTLVNAEPNIWVGDKGLVISAYLLFRIFIPWSDVIDVIENKSPLLLGYVVVRARRISIFHRVIGWIYSHSILPSFLIGKNIMGYDELIKIIDARKNSG